MCMTRSFTGVDELVVNGSEAVSSSSSSTSTTFMVAKLRFAVISALTSREGPGEAFTLSTMTPSGLTSSRGTELRSAVSAALMSSLEHIEAVGDTSVGDAQSGVRSLLAGEGSRCPSCPEGLGCEFVFVTRSSSMTAGLSSQYSTG